MFNQKIFLKDVKMIFKFLLEPEQTTKGVNPNQFPKYAELLFLRVQLFENDDLPTPLLSLTVIPVISYFL